MRTSKTRVLRFGIFAVLASTLAFACAEEEKKKKDDDDEGGGGSATTTTTTTSAGVGGSATTTTSTTATTTTSTGSGTFMCADVANMPINQDGDLCPNANAAACECLGCGNFDPNACEFDGTAGDDCTCSECLGDPNCQNCNNDGTCDPFAEDCNCTDCAGHPNCN